VKAQEHTGGHDSPAGPTDHYRLLRVDPDAPHELVAEAYCYLSSRLRAEQAVRRSAERELAALNAAYQVLAGAEQRRAYDAAVPRVLELRRERAERAEQQQKRPLSARLLKKPQIRPQVDYYELLGVDPEAEPALIARAYSILRTLHSKKAAGAAPKEYVSELEQAGAVLLDRARRAAYDESRMQPAPAPEAKPVKAPEVAAETNSLINWKMITIMLLLTFSWNSLLTNNTNGLVYVLVNTLNSMSKVFTNDLKSASVLTAISTDRGQSFTAQDIVNYSIETTKEYQSSKPYITKYDPTEYSSYTAEPIYSRTIPDDKHIDQRVFHVYPYISILLKIAMFFGLIYLLLHKTGKKMATIEYKSLCFISLVLILAFLTLPFLSLAYNFERLLQQSLILLALPLILGLYLVWRVCFIRREQLLFLISLSIILTYFIFSSGLANQFAGGSAYLQLNNFGLFYDRYYFHNSDQSSLKWLSDHRDKTPYIYADEYARLKFLPYSSITQDIIPDIIPSAIDKNAYVYSSYSNTIDKLAIVTTQSKQELSYNFPSEFLTQNKDKIYSSGYSEIFK
jgi:curved DNA-binding protein CbpA